MAEELKACSWCGIVPIQKYDNPPVAMHRCKALHSIEISIPLYAWQPRPLEDALNESLKVTINEHDALQAKLDIARKAFTNIDWSGLNATDNFEDMCRKLSKVAHDALEKIDKA